MYLYYDRDIYVTNVSIVCESDQSIEEGIIYELRSELLGFQSALFGGQIDINSDISAIKDFLGEGN